MFLSVDLSARDFKYVYEGKLITYNVLDEEAKTCEVAKNHYISGSLVLPAHPYDGSTQFTLTSIGPSAFWFVGGCDMTAVTIPNTVTNIGKGAFQTIGYFLVAYM